MGSIANLFEKNIRKVDAKKCVFCPKCRLCKGGLGGARGREEGITIFMLTNPF